MLMFWSVIHHFGNTRIYIGLCDNVKPRVYEKSRPETQRYFYKLLPILSLFCYQLESLLLIKNILACLGLRNYVLIFIRVIWKPTISSKWMTSTLLLLKLSVSLNFLFMSYYRVGPIYYWGYSLKHFEQSIAFLNLSEKVSQLL